MASHTLVDGIPMRWDETGEGLPVILLHGLPTSPAVWRLVTPLVRNARCLAWEMVGYGWSMREGEGRDLSLAAQTEYLVSWMNALEVENAVFVGHDLGGGLAQRMAALHPERVLGLVLVDSISYRSWPIPSVRALAASGGIVSKLSPGALKELFRVAFRRGHRDARIARASLDVHFAPYEQLGGAPAFVRQVRALHAEDTEAVSAVLPRLDVPTRVVWGAQDPFQKLTYGEQLARDLAAPLERIRDGRHYGPEDHPERIAAAIHALCEEVTFRGRAPARLQSASGLAAPAVP